ncbi:MAG: MnhB domain-containing protein [Ilumatobacteraceae bacterium]|nr:MnhB domain-containing protein [Ilumatobacteraceae bacterium]
MNMLRSAILTELVNRWLTKVATLVAIYMTFRGHNAPGGGFAGGLVLGAAFVLQFLAGQQPTIRRRPIRQPAALLGAGLLLSLGTTAAPLLVGAAALESHWCRRRSSILVCCSWWWQSYCLSCNFWVSAVLRS